jgi:hypothetical protein
MQYALGCKLVQFESMSEIQFNTSKGIAERPNKVDRPGYKVVYEDGYTSWSPKEVFEKFYLPLESEDGSKLEKLDIEKMFFVEKVTQKDEKTTEVKTNTLTGFVQYDYSSCVDPKNYDPKIGEDVCVKRMDSIIWKCMGFILQWARFGLNK